MKLPASFGPTDAPERLFVEGVAVTAGSREVELTLSLAAGATVVEDRVRLSVVRVDLDVDSDRDGAVDDLEDEADVRLAELRTPRLDQVRSVHLFDEIKPGQTVFWGGPGEVDLAADVTSRVNIRGNSTLGVEGLFFRYTEPRAYGGAFADGYDGLLDLELEVIAADGQLVGADKVRLRVAPFVVLPNTQDALEMWGRDSSLDDFRAANQDTVVLQPYYTGGDQWTQDHIVLRLPRSKLTTDGMRDNTPTWPQDNLLGKDVGLFRFQNTHLIDGLNSGDSGGNIELAPPTADWPLGRIVVGDTMGPRLFRFFQDQQIQAPIMINTDWLTVGHVDEIIAFVPDGDRWSVVAADPELAMKLIAPLEDDAVFFAEGRTSAGMGLIAGDASSATRLVDKSGTDFRQPDWEYARYVRIYEGKGAGQVARISGRGG